MPWPIRPQPSTPIFWISAKTASTFAFERRGAYGTAAYTRALVATVLYVYPRLSSFIEIDREALAERHEVVDYAQRGKVPRLLAIARGLRRADVVVGWWASWHTFVPFTLAWLMRKPSLLIVGGFDVAAIPEVGFGYQLGGFRRWASRWIIARAD